MEGGAGLGNVVIFLLGFGLAGALGWVLTKLRASKAMMQAPNRPMSVQTTTKPADVYRTAAQGRRQYCLLMVALIVLGLFACFIVSQLVLGCSLT